MLDYDTKKEIEKIRKELEKANDSRYFWICFWLFMICLVQ